MNVPILNNKNMKHVCRFFIVCFAMLLIGQSYSYAAESFLNENMIQQLQSAKENQKQSKIHPLIQQTEKKLQEYKQAFAQTAPVQMSSVSTSFVHVNDQGGMHVYIYVNQVSEALLTALEENNVQIEIINEELNIIQAWLPTNALSNIEVLPNVAKINPPSYSTALAGSVTTEGDAILRADEVRTQGVTGAGARVGVISDGVGGLSTSQSTGDLPANVTVLRAGSGAEGTAMLEIVHDLAPDATLGFCGPTTSLGMIQCINILTDTFNADIIVDDLGFFLEPYFEDGAIANTVANVIAEGVTYISAAGNQQQVHHEARFISSSSVTGIELHDFGIAAGADSDYSMNIVLQPGQPLTAILQWNDPFGASSNDYDLLLVDETETVLLASSEATQDGNDNPIEMIGVISIDPNPLVLKLLVSRISGVGRRLEIHFPGRGGTVQHNIPQGAIFGHQAVPNVLSTATINQNEQNNDEIAPYSSWGPSRIDFPSIQFRQKPDITGIDGVSVTGAGGFPSTFFGTSAAAPHIAGIAALLKSARPSATNQQIRNAITQSAVDLGLAGFDIIYGAGRADAAAALQNLESALPPPPGTEINAVNDDFSGTPIDGEVGGNTASVYSNDTLDGESFANTDVTPSIVSNGGLTGVVINNNGTLTVPAGTAANTYTVNYQICQVNDLANCDTANVTIQVSGKPEIPHTVFFGASHWAIAVLFSATQSAIHAGSAQGRANIEFSSVHPAQTSEHTFTNLPMNGQAFYATLFAFVNGARVVVDANQYTAADIPPAEPEITSPSEGTTLTGSSLTVTWDTDGFSATQWAIHAGSAQGRANIEFSSVYPAQTSEHTFTNLPMNGQAFYVTLFAFMNGAWVVVDANQYTAAL